MSYILDALQRADAERERARVPGLQSQLVPPGKVGQATAKNSPFALAVLSALLALLAATSHWQEVGNTTPEPPRISTQARPTPATAQAPQRPLDHTNWVPSAPILAPARPPIARTATPAASPAFTHLGAPTLDELAPEVRSRLPAFHVSGSTYSQNPALRTLIANGKVVQEGHDIEPGLRLERIHPQTAVLNHQGLRFSIDH